MSAIDDILALEVAQIGYPEQGNNVTKFSTELDSLEHPRIGRQGSPWCGTFQDWAFYEAGALGALPIRSFGTVLAARTYIAKGSWYTTPQRGDLAFLHTTGKTGHVGMVESFTDATVTTIEGNTSGGLSGSQTDGGHVARRTRPLEFWAGFGRPNYPAPVSNSDLVGIGALVDAVKKLTLQRDAKGVAVWVLQNALHLDTDSDFGPQTEKGVRAFQAWYASAQWANGIRAPYLLMPRNLDGTWETTGIVDSHTWAALLGDGGES